MYNAEKRVIVLESNATLLNELKGAIERQGDFNVVYICDDGETGVKQIEKIKPDLVIVSTFLKGLDGCGVIRAMKAAGLQSKIIATGVSGEAIIDRAIREGADYYLIKPFSIPGALELIQDLCEEKDSAAEHETTDAVPQKRRTTSLEEKISDIFISIGIPPHIKGYAYLREGIKMTVKTPRIINNVTKELYPGVAEIYKTTSSKVERAIRHAIEVAWNRGRIDAINAVFGTRVYLGTEKPTNSEFIALVADKLILENMM